MACIVAVALLATALAVTPGAVHGGNRASVIVAGIAWASVGAAVLRLLGFASFAWLPRMLAAGLVVALLVLLGANLWATGLLEAHGGECPTPTQSIWPYVVGFGLTGTLALRYALFGHVVLLGHLPSAAPRSALERARTAVWWSIFAVGLAGLAWVLARNATAEVLVVSAVQLGKFLAVVAALVGGFAALGWVMSAGHRRRMRACTAAYERMPPAVREAVLGAIDEAAARGEHAVLHRPVPGAAIDPLGSHLGGAPYAEVGEPCPTGPDGTPGTFLLQLRLGTPRLGPVWQGRLVEVYLVDWELQVRSHAGPSPRRMEPRRPPAGAYLEPALPLVPLRIRLTRGYEDPGYDSAALLRAVPGLEAVLTPFGDDRRMLLSRILDPRAHRLGVLEACEVVVEGGEPEFIQNPHEPNCPECGSGMRFLFQFGDLSDQEMLGDAGVGYVFGCDLHPERCLGFVDCL